MRRIAAAAAPPGRTAGVIISGGDVEFRILGRCLDGLSAQPELIGLDGEILVCGPIRDLGFLLSWPHVKYVEFDTPSAKPFLIGKKKNYLVRAVKGPRQIVVFARIVFDPDVIRLLPVSLISYGQI